MGRGACAWRARSRARRPRAAWASRACAARGAPPERLQLAEQPVVLGVRRAPARRARSSRGWRVRAASGARPRGRELGGGAPAVTAPRPPGKARSSPTPTSRSTSAVLARAQRPLAPQGSSFADVGVEQPPQKAPPGPPAHASRRPRPAGSSPRRRRSRSNRCAFRSTLAVRLATTWQKCTSASVKERAVSESAQEDGADGRPPPGNRDDRDVLHLS